MFQKNDMDCNSHHSKQFSVSVKECTDTLKLRYLAMLLPSSRMTSNNQYSSPDFFQKRNDALINLYNDVIPHYNEVIKISMIA